MNYTQKYLYQRENVEEGNVGIPQGGRSLPTDPTPDQVRTAEELLKGFNPGLADYNPGKAHETDPVNIVRDHTAELYSPEEIQKAEDIGTGRAPAVVVNMGEVTHVGNVVSNIPRSETVFLDPELVPKDDFADTEVMLGEDREAEEASKRLQDELGELKF